MLMMVANAAAAIGPLATRLDGADLRAGRAPGSASDLGQYRHGRLDSLAAGDSCSARALVDVESRSALEEGHLDERLDLVRVRQLWRVIEKVVLGGLCLFASLNSRSRR